jgi:hypothetical protein
MLVTLKLLFIFCPKLEQRTKNNFYFVKIIFIIDPNFDLFIKIKFLNKCSLQVKIKNLL